jgi:phage repressor protein C with HTH and peptisase S24 domain
MTTREFDDFLLRVYKATGAGSQTDLAALLRVNRSAITQARKKNSIPAKWILRLYRAYGLNPDWVENGAGPMRIEAAAGDADRFRNIPKVKARLSAGGGSFEIGSEIQGYYAFQMEWLVSKGNPRRMVLMDIFGNSMEPELKDGDTVLIDESQKAILAGAVYAVGVDDTIMVKRIEKHPNKLVLISDNTDYAPIYLSGADGQSVRIIGKVVWVGREFR